MELVHDEKILWQGRPSWRAQISYFVVWIPLALLPVIIAGILTANDQGTGLPYYQWLLISLLLVIVVVAWDAIRRYSTLYVVTDQRHRLGTGGGGGRSGGSRLPVITGGIDGRGPVPPRADRPVRAGAERGGLAEPDGPPPAGGGR